MPALAEQVFLHPPDDAVDIAAGIVERLADHVRVARQRRKRDVVLVHEILKAVRRSQGDGVARLLQPDRQGQEGLHVAARAVSEEGNIHRRLVDLLVTTHA